MVAVVMVVAVVVAAGVSGFWFFRQKGQNENE